METLLHQEIEVLLSNTEKNSKWPVAWRDTIRRTRHHFWGPCQIQKSWSSSWETSENKTKQEWVNNRITNLDPPKMLQSSKPKTDRSHRDEGDWRAMATKCNPCADLDLSSSGDLVEMVDKDCVFDQSPAASEEGWDLYARLIFHT